MTDIQTLPSRLSRRPVFMGLGAWLLSPPGLAQQPAPTETPSLQTIPYPSPAPFTSHEFWERMLVLIEDTSQPPSKEKVEETLGMRFGRSSDPGPSAVHFAEPRIDWYFGVKLSSMGRQPDIQVWEQEKGPMQFSDGPLLWGSTVLKSLLENGWQRSRSLPHFYAGLHRYEKSTLRVRLWETKLEISSVTFTWLL